MVVGASLPSLLSNNNTSSSMEWPEYGGSPANVSGFYPSSAPPAMDVDPSYSLPELMAKERQEIEQYVRLQNAWLRARLVEQTHQQAASLLAVLESRASVLLSRKDEELAEAQKRTAELEELVKDAEQRRDAWEMAAREHEAQAVALGNAVEQVQRPCSSSTAAAAAAEEGGQESSGPCRRSCSSCGSRDSCVLFVPCRHLCSCKPCAAFAHSCPICGSVKSGSLEVLLA